MKIVRHYCEQSVDQEGNVETYCGVCGKDWGYYNTKIKWLDLKIWLHSLKIKITL